MRIKNILLVLTILLLCFPLLFAVSYFRDVTNGDLEHNYFLNGPVEQRSYDYSWVPSVSQDWNKNSSNNFGLVTAFHKLDNSHPAATNSTSSFIGLPRGVDQKGDGYYTYPSSVLKENGAYRMWYIGSDNVNKMYMATSPDGITWTKIGADETAPTCNTTCQSYLITLGSNTKGDDVHISLISVIKDENDSNPNARYKGWYSGHDGAYWRIYMAISPDGNTWTKVNNITPAPSNTTSTNGQIPLGINGSGDDAHAYAPSVIFDEGIFKMWYTGFDGSYYRIFMATSPDGYNWTKVNNANSARSDTTDTDGRIPLGSGGKGDVTYTMYPSVFRLDNILHMYYSGYINSAVSGIFHATSTDGGYTWEKENNTDLTGSNNISDGGRVPKGFNAADDYRANIPVVIYDNNQFRMWYGGTHLVSINKIDPVTAPGYGTTLYATSPDGSNWTKYDNTYYGGSNDTSITGQLQHGLYQSGDRQAMISSVIYDTVDTNDLMRYKAYYSGHDESHWRIFMAYSADGYTWTKYDNQPVDFSNTTCGQGQICLGAANSGDDAETMNPYVIIDNSATTDQRYKLWYSGYDGTNWRIFLATSPDGITWTKYNNALQPTSDTTTYDGGMFLGNTGTGDDFHTLDPFVIQDEGIYKMWYTGYDGTEYRIFYATSPDGSTWTKYNNSVPNVGNSFVNGSLDYGTSIRTPRVIKYNNEYWMWARYSTDRIMQFRSSDGINWRPFDLSLGRDIDDYVPNYKIVGGSITSGDYATIDSFDVIYDQNKFRIWYGSTPDASLAISFRDTFYAEIEDNKDWDKHLVSYFDFEDVVGLDNASYDVQDKITGGYMDLVTSAYIAQGLGVMDSNAMRTNYYGTYLGTENSNLTSYDTNFTVSLWFNHLGCDSAWDYVLGRSNAYGIFVCTATTTPNFGLHLENTTFIGNYYTGKNVTLGWHETTLVFDYNKVYLYLDGELELDVDYDVENNPIQVSYGGNYINIGAFENISNGPALFDEFKAWDIPFSAEEVRAEYQKTRTSKFVMTPIDTRTQSDFENLKI
ncbi:MAG: hypothetical protein WC915_06030, partial [archaeon]